MTTAIALSEVTKTYGEEPHAVHALRGVSTEIPAGSFCTIMGPSGSGKSTLLHLAGGLDTPTSGSITVAGQDIGTLSEPQLAAFRREAVGFVFQFFNLLPTLTAAENLALPLLLAGERVAKHQARLDEILERLGLANRGTHLPEELSGGELQRVALGRALVTRPAVLLADEPTGNLDTETGREILEFLQELTRAPDTQTTVVIVTHDPQAAAYGDFILTLRDGLLSDAPLEGMGTTVGSGRVGEQAAPEPPAARETA